MRDDIEQIVAEVVARVLASETRASGAPAKPDQPPSTLVLTNSPRVVFDRMSGLAPPELRRYALFSTTAVAPEPIPSDITVLRGAESEDAVFSMDVTRFERYLLCGISLPVVAHLAGLVVMDPIVDIVFAALCDAKAVFVEPIAERDDFQRLPAALKREFGALLKKIHGFGIREAEPFGEEHRPMRGRISTTERRVSARNPRRSGFDVLSIEDIRTLVDETTGRITVASGTRLTDLAQEYVEKNKIVVEHR